MSTIILILVFLVGLSLLLYPTVSDYWNSLRQSRAIAEYSKQVSDLDNEMYEQLWTEAQEYRETLIEKVNRYNMTEEEKTEYEALLDASSHRGLPSSKLFTNLDKLEEGDTFVLNVLDETLTYEIDQILVVKPDDVAAAVLLIFLLFKLHKTKSHQGKKE